jgi:cysteine synthase A
MNVLIKSPEPFDSFQVPADCGCFEAGAVATEESKLLNKFGHLWHLVGNTPMLEIAYRYKGKCRKLYVKCEHYNLTGSIKDRMALYILQKAYEQGAIKRGDQIVEATSGNTGIAFSAIGKALGHDVKIIMPDWLSKERIDIIKSLGAEVVLVSKEEGGFLGSISFSQQLARENANVFLPRQFENRYNAEAHEKTTAREIWMQLQGIDLTPDAFVAGVGTGGTIMGVGAYLKKRNPQVKIHPLEPAESPTLSTGYKVGSHRIQGISDEFIPEICQLSRLDEVMKASDGDSIIMAQKLARELGLAVGISSGANLIGAIELQNLMGDEAIVVTVLSDSNKKYLSTDLMKVEPVKDGYFSTDVEFIDYRAIRPL